MPHISKKKPRKELFLKIYGRLLEDVLQRGGRTARAKLLGELLTDTEKIMLAKRFVAISMLGEGFTFEEIQEKLNLSPSTIARFWMTMQRGSYRHTIGRVHKRNVGKSLIDSVLTLVIGALQPVHAPRWRWLDELE